MSATSTRSSLPRRCFFFLFSLRWKGKRREAAFRARPGMGSLAALRTVLVLVLVTGLAGCVPGLNGTADRLEALYSRSLARIPGEKREEMSRDSDYLLGIKRLRRLYCNVGIGFHIQVLPDGRITGVHNENRHSLLQISPVERGVVTLLGVRSGLFVAMSRRGKLYGSLHYNNECKFREKLLANNYNSYESVAYPRMYIGLKEKLITSGRYSGYEAKANIRSKELSCPLSKVACVPLTDQGPHITNGWDQVVRFRHLYATRPGLHLLISRDGQIHGSADQTLYSLLEIRPVDPGCVVIRGAATARFLCIEGEGRLYSSHTYSKDDCTFREQILPDGYNIYVSDRHGALLSLGNHRQRLQGRDRGVPALARFLPRVNTLDQTFHPALDVPDQPGQSAAQTEEPMDTMDSFGKLSQIIHSPSFHKR